MPSRSRRPVQSAIAKLKEATQQDDLPALRRAADDLKAAAQAMAQHLQSQQTAGAGGASDNGRYSSDDSGSSSQVDDEVIDAEYEVKA